jgi:hypothetical protein
MNPQDLGTAVEKVALARRDDASPFKGHYQVVDEGEGSYLAE